ncbi:oxygen-insensitive NADPH nitroreductase [Psychromonas sp. PT13]|uniref:oxygen-insensitive NADPH nitroreductase n=1 Tax=Psychromonas sp. PT13 TaxID=3439547 RepID=UPI003EB6AB0C
MNQTIDLLKNHRSIRKFTSEKVSDEKLIAIIESAESAATSNFIQAYSVIRVTKPENRKQLAAFAGGQAWIEQCPVFLVFCADLKRAQSACTFENKEMDSGYTEQFLVATVDVTLAAQNAMIAAESMGLGGVYIGGLRNQPDNVAKLLKLPEHVYPIFGMCLGYPDETPEQKPRMPAKMILKDDYYSEGDDDLSQYNEICSEYYKNRTSGSRDETWTHQIANMVSVPARPHMKGFLKQQGFDVK